MSGDEDKVLDAGEWRREAAAIINDIKCHVEEIGISEKLSNDDCCIYLNVKTLEGTRFCVEVSAGGFSVTGYDYDLVTTRENEKFETPYSLLDSISPQYRDSFGNELTKKLIKLARESDSGCELVQSNEKDK